MMSTMKVMMIRLEMEEVMMMIRLEMEEEMTTIPSETEVETTTIPSVMVVEMTTIPSVTEEVMMVGFLYLSLSFSIQTLTPSMYTDEDDELDDETKIINAYVTATDDFNDGDFDEAKEKFETVLSLEEKFDDAAKMQMNDQDLPCTFKALVYMCRIYLEKGKDCTAELKSTWNQILGLFGKDWVRRGDKDDAMSAIVNNPLLAKQFGIDIASELQASVLDLLEDGPVKFKAICDCVFKSLRHGKFNDAKKYMEDLKCPDGDAQAELTVMSLNAEILLQDRHFGALKRLRSKIRNNERFKSVIVSEKFRAYMHLAFGKMLMIMSKWDDAAFEFGQSLDSFQRDAQTDQSTGALRYLVLANVISSSHSDPFNRDAVRSLMTHDVVKALQRVRVAFEENDILNMEKLLSSKDTGIQDDSFASAYASRVMRTLRMKMLRELIGPFECVSLSYLEQELRITDVMGLLREMILDGTLRGRIDEIDGVYLSESGDESRGSSSGIYGAFSQWERGVRIMQYGVMAEMEKLEFKSNGSSDRRRGEFGGINVLNLLSRRGPVRYF